MSVAVVTGASRGLGRALATGLAGLGWSLVIDGRDRSTLAEVERALPGVRMSALAGDVTDPAHRAALVRAAVGLGGLDLLVNNAGGLGPSPLPPLEAYPLDHLAELLAVNAVAPLAVVQEALPALRRSTDPRVLNVTSDASVEAYPGWGGYGASKAALDHLTAVLAAEIPDVRFWAVDPGDLRTQMHQDAFPAEDISDRPLPETVVPDLLGLVGGPWPSGRYRVADLRAADAADTADAAEAADLPTEEPVDGARWPS